MQYAVLDWRRKAHQQTTITVADPLVRHPTFIQLAFYT